MVLSVFGWDPHWEGVYIFYKLPGDTGCAGPRSHVQEQSCKEINVMMMFEKGRAGARAKEGIVAMELSNNEDLN